MSIRSVPPLLTALALVAGLGARSVAAQQLPARWYDVRDGLASGQVNAAFEDAQGYLWLATAGGLSRFDGTSFENFGARDGMQFTNVTTVAEDRQGHIWFGTWGGGLGRLLDDPREVARAGGLVRMWRPPGNWKAAEIAHLFFDVRGTMWVTNNLGLWRVVGHRDSLRFEPVFRTQSLQNDLVTGDGRVWLADYDGLHEVVEGGIRHHAWPAGFVVTEGVSLEQDPGGGVLAANLDQLWRLVPGPSAAWERHPMAKRADEKLLAMLLRSDGSLWLATDHGVLLPEHGELHPHALSQDARRQAIRGLYEDRERHVWAFSANAGLARVGDAPILTWTAAEGVPGMDVARLTLGSDGVLYVQPRGGRTLAIVSDRGVPAAGGDAHVFEAGNELAQDARGDWWVSAPGELWRFAGPRLQFAHGERFTRYEGHPMPVMSGLARDGRDLVASPLYGGLSPDGSTGIGLPDSVNDRLVRWTPEAGRAPEFRPIRLPHFHGARRFVRTGAWLWFASWTSLSRERDGVVETIPAQPGLQDTIGRALFVDHRGWLWFGTRSGGVSLCRVPDAEHAKFERIPLPPELAGTPIPVITEDRLGRMYFASVRGLERYDPGTRRFRHFDERDGLPGDIIRDLLADGSGALWIGTNDGLARLMPGPDAAPLPAPAVLLTRIDVAGVPVALPARGVRSWRLAPLASDERRLAISFSTVRLDGRETRFQYRLDGVDRAWSEPATTRAVSYAWLPARSLRFRVRAVGDDGAPGTETVMAFAVAAPLVQQPWFVTLVLLALGLVGYLWHRARLRQALALERIRRQIAVDLHDDIGAGLSQIAVLSEVARRDGHARAPMLEQVADLAREMRESMSDIVWSVDPRRDQLSDLVRRMRQVANQLLEAPGVVVTFEAPPASAVENLSLSPDRRRHVFLIYKEALHNIAKHARAARVAIALRLARGRLTLSIRDDGVGFDGQGRSDGHGLASMRQRAALLGARLDLVAVRGEGTMLTLELPLRAAEPAPA